MLLNEGLHQIVEQPFLLTLTLIVKLNDTAKRNMYVISKSIWILPTPIYTCPKCCINNLDRFDLMLNFC
jgi:hypothetical protein